LTTRAQRGKGREIAVLCAGAALGTIVPLLQPFWVPAFTKARLLGAPATGRLAAGESLLIALGCLFLSVWGRRLNPRLVTAGAAALVAAGNALSIIPSVPTMIAGRLLSGFGGGMTSAAFTGLAVRRPKGQRVLALTQVASFVVALGLVRLFPYLIGHEGPWAMFAAIAFLGLGTSVADLCGLPDTPLAEGRTAGQTGGGTGPAPLLGCLGLASASIAVHVVTRHTLSIGNGLGFRTADLTGLHGALFPLVAIGPLIGWLLAERFGLIGPLLASLAAIVAAVLLLVSARSLLLFGSGLAILFVAATFYLSYAIALIDRADPSGGYACAAPAAEMLGGVAGPAIGALLIARLSGWGLAGGSALLMALGAALFAAAAKTRDCTSASSGAPYRLPGCGN
jgi:hypothetical protein